MSLPYTVRPLEPWIGKYTAGRRASPFSATWTSTLELLDRELRQIGARRWVLQVDVMEHQIRNDGGIYARATPFSPAVRIAFESRHGPLVYACDRFTHWQDNVRAIALSLEALRKVDRYGVAGAGEQYRGWVAIEARSTGMIREAAAGLIVEWSGLSDRLSRTDLLNGDNDALAVAYRAAARRVHPDVTGDDGDSMARLNAARDLLVSQQ